MDINKINSKADIAYSFHGGGIGAGKESMDRYPPQENERIFDLGFGGCGIANIAIKKFNCTVFGVDIAEGSLREAEKQGLIGKGLVPFLLDASHEKIPLPNNFIDRAYCTATLEHLSNPLFAISEVKRLLKNKGKFIIEIPRPESNLGYDGGKHAHIYPGFLLKDSFERFMMQLYFKKLEYTACGDSGWYLFENVKDDMAIVDVFHVVSENYTEEELYGWLNE